MKSSIIYYTTLFLCCSLVALMGCKDSSKEISRRREAVEQGLLPTFAIQGQTPPRMTISDRMQQYYVPGVSIAVINNDNLEWAEGYGVVEAGNSQPVTTQTLFQAASISKLVTAVSVLSLIEEGQLRLDEDVNLVLQSWKVPDNEYTKEQKVTLRRLLSHSAGLTVREFVGYIVSENVPTLIQILNGQEPANTLPVRVVTTPGSTWQYSGGGYLVVQQLLEDITGQPFSEFIQNQIFDKLDMKNSTFSQSLPQSLATSAATGHQVDGRPLERKWHLYPEMAAAGLWTTPSDLARLVIEIQQSKAGRSNRLFSKTLATTLLTPQIGNTAFAGAVKGEGKTSWFSSGGSNVGFKSFTVIFPEIGQGAIVMTNADNGHYLAMEIMRGIAQVYDWPGFQVQEKSVIKIASEIYKTYAGEYAFSNPPGLMMRITHEDDRLFVELPGAQHEIYPESETTYFEPVSGMMITFMTNPDSGKKELLLIPPLSSQQWEAEKIS